MERDFSSARVNPLRWYGGANGNKISIDYEGKTYMLKFPPKASANPDMSYSNSCFSEYIACHIFQSLGIDAQETLLGRYGDKITVACRDLSVDGFELKEFALLKNTIIDSSENGYGTELEDVLNAIGEQQVIDPAQLEAFFWDMFVADALLGNFDRHNGNWGFLINQTSGQVKIAPVFDCGSCLYPQIQEDAMEWVLGNEEEIERRIYTFPTSALKQNGKKINYAQFLLSTELDGCIRALKKIGSRIDMEKIEGIIDGTPYISEIHKRFLKTMISKRKQEIIDKALERFEKP